MPLSKPWRKPYTTDLIQKAGLLATISFVNNDEQAGYKITLRKPSKEIVFSVCTGTDDRASAEATVVEFLTHEKWRAVRERKLGKL